MDRLNTPPTFRVMWCDWPCESFLLSIARKYRCSYPIECMGVLCLFLLLFSLIFFMLMPPSRVLQLSNCSRCCPVIPSSGLDSQEYTFAWLWYSPPPQRLDMYSVCISPPFSDWKLLLLVNLDLSSLHNNILGFSKNVMPANVLWHVHFAPPSLIFDAFILWFHACLPSFHPSHFHNSRRFSLFFRWLEGHSFDSACVYISLS